jgi:hypothetical protein
MHIKSTSDLGDHNPRLSFVLPPELAVQVREFAATTERSLAAVVRLALRELLAADNRSAARRTVR